MKTVFLVYLVSLHWDGTYSIEPYSDRVYRSERACLAALPSHGALDSRVLFCRRVDGR